MRVQKILKRDLFSNVTLYKVGTSILLKCFNCQDLVKTAITNAAVEETQPESREGKR